MADKRMTEDEVVARLRVGHDDRHRRVGEPAQADVARAGHPAQRPHRPHLVTYGGPDVGMLCAAGKVAKLTFAFVSLDSIPLLEPHFRTARQTRRHRRHELDEGMFLLGLQAAAWRVPFLPTRVGLGLRPVPRQPRAAHGPLAVPGPTAARARSWSPCRRSTLDAALVPPQRRRRARQRRRSSGPTSTSTTCSLEAADAGGSCRSSGSSPPRSWSTRRATCTRCGSAGCSSTAWSRRPTAPTPRRAIPTTAGTRRSRRQYVAHRQGPRGVGRRSGPQWLAFLSEADYQAALADAAAEEPTSATRPVRARDPGRRVRRRRRRVLPRRRRAASPTRSARSR